MSETKVLPRPLLTAAARVALIQRVLRTIYHNTESFRDNDLSCELAYLALAIAEEDPDLTWVDWSADNADSAGRIKEARAQFREWFPLDDPVWQFIIT